VISYFRRLREFRDATMERNQRAAQIHRIFVIGSLVMWVGLFALSHRAMAVEAASASGTKTEATTPATIPGLPALPPAVPSSPTGAPVAAGSSIPATPGSPTTTAQSGGPASLSIDLGNQADKPSSSVMIIIGLTLLSLAPSIIIMMTSFTRMVIVLSLTRNALGLQSIPPNQVVVGLALFLSLFVMSPTLSKMNEVGLQPLLKGTKSQSEALSDASQPLKQFMLANTRRAELKMMISASGEVKPATPDKVSLTTLIPAFILSELKTAFIIGFAIFIPFLVIDLVVSSILMALGMMMLPPSFISLPFKLLMFVMVDGWSMVAQSLMKSFKH
jgi:flagellar biosynthetic protein FliP